MHLSAMCVMRPVSLGGELCEKGGFQPNPVHDWQPLNHCTFGLGVTAKPGRPDEMRSLCLSPHRRWGEREKENEKMEKRQEMKNEGERRRRRRRQKDEERIDTDTVDAG